MATTVHAIGANIARQATFSMTNEDLNYPATNGNNGKPFDPLKATTTATAITLSWAAAKTLQALSIHMHNLVGATVTLTNSAGFSQAIVIPARTSRGRCVDAWIDLRGLALTLADTWTVTISGAAANVSIGEIAAVSVLSDLPFDASEPIEQGEHELVEVIQTTYGTKHKFEYAARIRFARGRLVDDLDRAAIYALWQFVAGSVDPFLFIPDVAANDPWLSEFDSATVQWSRRTPELTPLSIGVTELSGGLVP